MPWRSFPAGFGTLDEAMETLTLVQTGKRNPLPLVLVDDPVCSYWTELIKFVEEELLTRNLISKTDLALFERFDSVEAAVARINRFYSRYHSMRYVDGKLVFRLTSQLSAANISKLTEAFATSLSLKVRSYRPAPFPLKPKTTMSSTCRVSRSTSTDMTSAG